MNAAWREIVRFALMTPLAVRAHWHEWRSDRSSALAQHHNDDCLRLARAGIAVDQRYPSLYSQGS